MFKSISWQLYLQALLIASTIYYLVILILYYRRDVRYWVMNFRRRRSRLGKFITRCTEKDESDVIGGADPHESSDEIDGASDTNENLITNN